MNRYERVKAVLDNGTPDRIPAGFWYHYDSSFDVPKMIDCHLRTFRESGVDVCKIMQEYIQHIDQPITTASDWRKVTFPGKESKVYQDLLAVVKGILDATGHDAFTFQTMYGPLKTLTQTYGYDMVMHYAKEDPDALLAAEMAVAESQAEWAAGFIEAGADGLFFSGQFSEPGRFTHEEFEKLVTAGDLVLLSAAEKAGGRNILHICGEPDYDFHSIPEWYTGYPFAIVNWSVKDTGISLQQGRVMFGDKPILGGMNNRGNILKGSDAEIQEEAESVIAGIERTSGFMLGADCTIQGEGIENRRIRVAVETAHAHV